MSERDWLLYIAPQADPAGLSILANNHPTYTFSKNVPDTVEFPGTLHEFTVQNGDVSGASDLVYPQGNPLFGVITE